MVEGARAPSVVAFIREQGEHWLLVAAPRLPLPLLHGSADIAVAPRAWLDTVLRLDPPLAQPVIDALTCRPVELPAGRMPMGGLCRALPFVLLTNRA